MTRETAYTILTKYLKNQTLLKHSLATEAVMRALSQKLGGDIDEWGVTGLLHDADYEKSKSHPEKHGTLLFQLEPNSIPSKIEHAIQAHNFEFTKVMATSPMDWALTCCDELTGVIMELAHKQKDKKLTSLKPELIIEELNKHAKSDHIKPILLCDEKLQIPLAEFVTSVLSAMQKIEAELLSDLTKEKSMVK